MQAEAKPGRLRAALTGALPSMLSVLLALVVCFVAIAVTRGDVIVAAEAYLQMLWGGLGDFPAFFEGAPVTSLTRPLGESGTKASLLILTGLSVAVAFKVGLFNIGAQGQLMWGGLFAAVAGAYVPAPGGLHLLLCLVAAGLAGALWALIPTALKLHRGVHEVISTIMLNWIAVSFVENWLVVGPLKAGAEGDLSRSGTEEILPSAQLPRLLGDLSRLHLGFVIALLAAFVIFFWLRRTTHGFETRAVGLGSDAARAAGIPNVRRTYTAMAIAGALAGLAGALLVLGSEMKYPGRLAAPYGFDGIAISLIGNNHPIGVAVSALLFGILRAGGTRMQLLGVHKSFPELIQGLALLFVAGRLAWTWLLSRKKEAGRA